MLSLEKFPPLLLLRDNWNTIADECANLDRDDVLNINGITSREEVARALMAKPRWIKGWDGCDKWLNWGIAIQYQYPLGNAGMPRTANLLRQVSGLKFASISLFEPGALLKTHSHPEMSNEKLLTFHLGLHVPEQCFLNVDGEFERERDGKGIVFDGSQAHYAFNASDKDRYILHCEFAADKLYLTQ